MDEEYKGKILLQGFDQDEIEKIKKIIERFDIKFARLEYEEIRLSLKRHKKGGNKGKAYLNEIKGLVKLKNTLLHAEITSHELYSGVEEIMEKMLVEAEHKIRKET